ncbi:hypothetical protein HAX54_043766 [Datura stramonium]|uniref:Uncharacterized protein n=1 Tax=Datura stramonium TaxID=4076 RepID=A0ABS8SNK3_DATST|nr:hypothetical protein [Datura stramonium]
MAPKSSKGKGVASSSQGPKRERMVQEALMEDARMPQQPPREIRHTLSGPRSVAKWTRHQQFKYHMTFPYAHIGIELRMSGVTEEQLQQLNVDYQLSEHSRALYRVGPGLEEPFDNDDPTNDEKARVDSNLKYDVDDGDDSEMGEVAYALIDEED